MTITRECTTRSVRTVLERAAHPRAPELKFQTRTRNLGQLGQYVRIIPREWNALPLSQAELEAARRALEPHFTIHALYPTVILVGRREVTP